MSLENQALRTEMLNESLTRLSMGLAYPFDVAVLAGRLSRYPQPDTSAQQALAAACTLRDTGVLDGAVPEAEVFDAAVDRLAHDDEVDGVSSPEDRLEALDALDALCAGSWFLQDVSLALRAVDLAADSIDAFPQPWEALAAHAAEVLVMVPPAPDDPAKRLWASVHWLYEPTARTALPAGRTCLRVGRIVGDGLGLVMAFLALQVLQVSGVALFLALVVTGVALFLLDHVLCRLFLRGPALRTAGAREGSHVE